MINVRDLEIRMTSVLAPTLGGGLGTAVSICPGSADAC